METQSTHDDINVPGIEEELLRRHNSVSDNIPESNVLRKVASLTIDRATLEQRVTRPKNVPQKLEYQIYEKFEGEKIFLLLLYIDIRNYLYNISGFVTESIKFIFNEENYIKLSLR
jgi:formin 2